jgi:hypothetical protein
MPSQIMLVQPKFRELVSYSITASTSDQVQSTQVIEPLGDIVALQFDLSVVLSGTLSAQQPITKAIKRIALTDRNGIVIMDIAGADLDKLEYWLMGGEYKYTTIPNADTTTKSVSIRLNLPIKISEQPAKLQITFAPYSDLASGATGGTYTLKVRVWYGVALQTLRVFKRSVSLASGDNALGYQLPDGVNTQIFGFVVSSESAIIHITFSADGTIDHYAKITLNDLAKIEYQVFDSGHITGIFNLFVAPFRTDISKTRFTVNANASATMDIYLIGS